MSHHIAHHKSHVGMKLSKRKAKILHFAQKVALICLILGFIGSGIASLWFANLEIPDLQVFTERKVSESTKIFDRTGKILLYDVHENTKRTVIPFEDISRHVKNATIAIEYAEFYSHFGIQPKSILRAVLANLTPGGLKQGGSTITQQVIKNTVLTADKTITRKIKEWVLAIKLERTLSKDQILGIYLNETPYGGNIYGVEEASQTFFGVSAKDLSLAQAAYIAALPQAPSFYSPYGKNTASLDNRKTLVLKKMREYGFITDEELTQALNEKVNFLPKNNVGIRAPHFALLVRDILIEKYGEEKVEQGGLKVITTLNYDMQDKAEKTLKRFSASLEENYNATNQALVAIDPKTGDVLSMVGSRDYFDKKIDGNFNVATALRQPGSSFKPFVYATALTKGYTPETIFFDTKTEFSSECNPDGTPKNKQIAEGEKNPCYSPQNYDGTYAGPMTMKHALAQSRNIPAIKALYLSGIKESINTAEAMGITSLTTPERYGLTLVLGGGEVSLLDLTSAYGVFANDGIRNPYRTILKVEDKEGNVIEQATEQPSQAISPNVARQITDMLSDQREGFESVNQFIRPLRREVATKTGTTNDFRDVWIASYTPDIAVGLWSGRNDNTPMGKKVAGLIIVPVWGAFMSEIKDMIPVTPFKKPDPTPTDLKPVFRGIWKGGRSYTIDKISGKLATEFTPEETKQEMVFNEVHSILHWVDKNDPLGEIPTRPENDNQYENWEYGVRNWFKNWQAQNPTFLETNDFTVPKERDDIHTKESIPVVTIISPIEKKTYSKEKDSSLLVQFNTIFRYPFAKSELYINGKLVSSSLKDTSSFNVNLSKIDNLSDKNTLRVVVTDSAYNNGESSVEFSVK